jgi:hypothetical protein
LSERKPEPSQNGQAQSEPDGVVDSVKGEHAAQALATMEQVKCIVDLLEVHPVSNTQKHNASQQAILLA